VAIPRGLWRHFLVLRQEKKPIDSNLRSLVSILLVHHFRRNLAHSTCSKGKVKQYPRLSIHLSLCVYFCMWFGANTEIEWYKCYPFIHCPLCIEWYPVPFNGSVEIISKINSTRQIDKYKGKIMQIDEKQLWKRLNMIHNQNTAGSVWLSLFMGSNGNACFSARRLNETTIGPQQL
jgi:hypothetical protein